MTAPSYDDNSHPAAGTQSIDRAVSLLLLAGRAGIDGARPTDLITQSGLPKPTVRRVLLALVRAGLLEQDAETRRYHIGPEAYVLGLLAGSRFGIHAKSLDALTRLSQATGDTAFLSVPRDTHSVCLHREEGSFPIRSHVLQVGDRHPLGIGAGSLAMLASYPDSEVDRIIESNARLIDTKKYESFSPRILRALVQQTRSNGYSHNPGMLVAGSWGVGVAIRGADGRPVGALSIAAIERRLDDSRLPEIAPLLQEEAARIEQTLIDPSADTTARRQRHLSKATNSTTTKQMSSGRLS